jgi:hypothetical protein
VTSVVPEGFLIFTWRSVARINFCKTLYLKVLHS